MSDRLKTAVRKLPGLDNPTQSLSSVLIQTYATTEGQDSHRATF